VKLLLDTRAFLWFATGDRRLGRMARAALEHTEAQLFLSAASVWELAIKSSLKRLVLPDPIEQYVAEKIAEGYHVMPIEWPHVAAVERLPFFHRDPFDRLLAAQALAEKMPMITADKAFKKYGVRTIW
jgi:PIN domain nuclease of toxin-antitoxin system